MSVVLRQAPEFVARKLCVNGTELYLEDTGGYGEPLLFSHGLLWNTRLFQPQVNALRSQYRCISYDHRGQGRSAEVHHGDEIDVDTLCDDVVELIAALGLGPVHFCGLSLGGFVGMRLAMRRPELIRSLVLCSTSADSEPEEKLPKFRFLNFISRWLGPRFVINPVMPIMYGKTALNDPARSHERRQWRTQLLHLRRSIWRATNGVLNRDSMYAELSSIVCPTLVLVGEEDLLYPPEKAERIVQAIEGSRLVRIPRAGHTPPLEEPASVIAALSNFLSAQRS